MGEVFVSVDVESDGPIPGPNSMLSFGAAAFIAPSETPIATFSANLELLEGASGDPDTMKWWKTQPEAWEAHRQDLQSPEVAIKNFVAWAKALPGKPVFVAYPAGYDFLFMYWHMIKFAGESPFGFQALDIKTYAMRVMKTDFRGTSKKTMPKRWFDNSKKHSHVALDDATEQGILFLRMLREP